MIETPDVRRRTMQAVRSVDTAPEMAIRRLLYAQGYRYRLHRKELPGKPDIVFIGRRKAIFAHGCFWHGHDCARGSRKPKSNMDYWGPKIAKNRARDARARAELEADGWQVLVIWECETRDPGALKSRLSDFLGARVPLVHNS